MGENAFSDVILYNINWNQLRSSTRFNPKSHALPLELLYLADAFDKKGISNRILDGWAERKGIQDWKEQIQKAKIIAVNTAPAYVYWRCCPNEIWIIQKELKEIRQQNPEAKILLFGPHPTSTPNIFVEEEVDYIVPGEVELSLPAVVEKLLQGKETEIDAVMVRGDDGKWEMRGVPGTPKELDDMPVLTFSQLPLERYAPHNPPKEFEGLGAVYEASRGCPYDCIYCFRDGFRKEFRVKSFERIEQELKALQEKGVTFLYLMDEIFLIKKAWSEQVAELLHKYGMTWTAMSRPLLLRKELITHIAKNGCKRLCLGVESADNEILKIVGKRDTNTDRLAENIHHMIEEGIEPHMFLMVGAPKETKESLNNTIKFVSQFPRTKVRVSHGMMVLYPETGLSEMVKEEGHNLQPWEEGESIKGTIGNDFTNRQIKRLSAVFDFRINEWLHFRQRPATDTAMAVARKLPKLGGKMLFPTKTTRNSNAIRVLANIYEGRPISHRPDDV